MRLFIPLVSLVIFGFAMAADVDHATINRIIDEGFNHSELPQTASYLMDRIGGRMTNSPQMRQAEKWTQEQFRGYGLVNVHAEPFDFGRGWSIERAEARMVTPRVIVMHVIPVAWTPSTPGTISAGIVVAPMRRESDFAKWKGQLKGKVVLVDRPSDGSEPDKPPFRRLTDEEIGKLDAYQQPAHSEKQIAKRLKRGNFEAKRDAFLAAEGALAWMRQSYRDGGLLHGEGSGYRVGQTPKLAGIEVAAEDYRRLTRLAKSGVTPTVELTSVVRYHDEDHNAYNIIGEIPGRDPKAGYVMIGAHLDSWVAADGASDNGAGSVAVLEAARILSKLSVKPKRTLRFALWAGEEQGLLGSMAYVERYLAERPPVADPEQAKLSPYATWFTRWPIKPKPGSESLAAYFNLDNGSGKIRGIYTEGNVAVTSIFREWLAPFVSMGATRVVSEPTGGTDHVLMQSVGIPAFQFIQDPLD
ncbi:MAG TPA: M20/M25/M40 family metallo-hydrolase, partial [Steroidobacteraceae bacterium]|nr:M20/M25/M40 family metallo-hydrolase [Steroidobacteraceae bacterium]